MMRAVSFLLALAASAPAGPRIFYSKDFPGSSPAYVEITLAADGVCEYREAKDDEYPVKLQLPPADARDIFALADRLDRFSRPLESPLKVAKMGTKTFRFEEDGKRQEVAFNFSEDLDARALAEWFEKIAETGQHYILLERTVKFDKLGVNKALLLLESSLGRGRVVSAPLFLPLLDRVAKNESYLNMARTRAANLADLIRAVNK